MPRGRFTIKKEKKITASATPTRLQGLVRISSDFSRLRLSLSRSSSARVCESCRKGSFTLTPSNGNPNHCSFVLGICDRLLSSPLRERENKENASTPERILTSRQFTIIFAYLHLKQVSSPEFPNYKIGHLIKNIFSPIHVSICCLSDFFFVRVAKKIN